MERLEYTNQLMAKDVGDTSRYPKQAMQSRGLY
jgi:hypothetical protein